MFIFHHIIGLLLLYACYLNGIPETWYHNLGCFCGEISNPFLNARIFTKQYQIIHKMNKMVVLFCYTVFRMVGLPYIAYRFFVGVKMEGAVFYMLIVLSMIVEDMSIIWYKDYVGMCLNLATQKNKIKCDSAFLPDIGFQQCKSPIRFYQNLD